MADNAERAEADGKAVDEEEQGLNSNNAVDKAAEQFFGKYCVLFN